MRGVSNFSRSSMHGRVTSREWMVATLRSTLNLQATTPGSSHELKNGEQAVCLIITASGQQIPMCFTGLSDPFPMRSLIATISLCLIPAVASAQLAPDGTRLKAGADTMISFIIDGRDTVETGILVDAIERTTLDGRDVIRRVYRTADRVLGQSVDTIIDDARTLAPIQSRRRSPVGIALVDFTTERATGIYVQTNGDTLQIDVKVPTPVFSGSSFDLVLRSSPLAPGWRVTVPVLVPSSRVVMEMNARVEGLETIQGRPCWRVEAEFGGMSVGFWVDQKTRQLCQQVMRPRTDFTILFKPM